METRSKDGGVGDHTYVAIKWVFATAVAYWTILPHSIKLLVTLMACDVIMGVLAGVITRSISSERSFHGLMKKTMILVLVGVVHYVGDQLQLGMDLGQLVGIGYCVNELISILENCVRAGVPIPVPLVTMLAKFRYRPTSLSEAEFKDDCAATKQADEVPQEGKAPLTDPHIA